MTETAGTAQPAVLRLSGDVDALTQQTYRLRAEKMFVDSEVGRLVIDMGEVKTIDSSGLGLLVHLQAVSREHDASMVLINVPPRADALLRRTGLNRVFAIEAP